MRSLMLIVLMGGTLLAADAPWTASRARAWGRAQGWLAGANYVPASATNELEMWQAATFDPVRIDRELGWAEGLGMNTMRVFLHDLLWQQDPQAFLQRIDQFLDLTNRHHIRPIFVLFDSCWDPDPKLGRQAEPRPGIHNSRWVQSPGLAALADSSQHARLEAYVKGVVGKFAADKRVLAWDIWNEPDNRNDSSYADPASKIEQVEHLLTAAFDWARAAHPSQPLTSGVWAGDWSADNRLTSMQRIQLTNSDVISFHNYDSPAEFEQRILQLRRYRRPILCTEYMARLRGNTFQSILPIAKRQGVAAINWGFVAGRSQTYLPWDSWQKPYIDHEPPVWFHDIFQTDGKPHREEEVTFIRQQTGHAAK